LNIAREKAVRSFHEAKCHEDNIFLTLTYDDEHLESSKLIYEHFQKFMKSLRERVTRGIETKELRDEKYIPYMVTGEYGEVNKRPHWHAILFNYRPEDAKYKYTTDLGENVYESEIIDSIWKKGNAEFGTVTMESAGYVARYAAKKLVHGRDEDHDYHPIHKTSCKRAIGRSWIEKYWKHTFQNGFIVLPNGEKCRIPRYYVDWLKEHRFNDYVKYVNGPQQEAINYAEKEKRKEEMEFISSVINKRPCTPYPITMNEMKLRILKSKFKELQKELKL
jgi:alpha-galactosidase/6-phospho-beta-glucosidase family protein